MKAVIILIGLLFIMAAAFAAPHYGGDAHYDLHYDHHYDPHHDHHYAPAPAAELLHTKPPDNKCLRREGLAECEEDQSAPACPLADGESHGRGGGAAAGGSCPQHHILRSTDPDSGRAARSHGGPLPEHSGRLWPRALAALFQPQADVPTVLQCGHSGESVITNVQLR